MYLLVVQNFKFLPTLAFNTNEFEFNVHYVFERRHRGRLFHADLYVIHELLRRGEHEREESLL